VLLRNGLYLENYTTSCRRSCRTAPSSGAAGEGRISAASRADYAEAAAVVLTAEGHTGAVYQLGGDESSRWLSSPPRSRWRPEIRFTYTDLP